MVAGFTQTFPNIPCEERYEQLKDMMDKKLGTGAYKSPLSRPIQLITPEVHKDTNFIVPNLLQHNMGGQFATGINLTKLNGVETDESAVINTEENKEATTFKDRSHSINVLLSKNNQKASLHNDILIAKID